MQYDTLFGKIIENIYLNLVTLKQGFCIKQSDIEIQILYHGGFCEKMFNENIGGKNEQTLNLC